MIVVRQKKLEDIQAEIAPYKRVLLVGCNTCAAVALAGGENETSRLASTLRLRNAREGGDKEYSCTVLQRQCEPEFLNELDHSEADVILSLGCGAGVALLSEIIGKPTMPALDTLFIGAARGYGSWRAECSACGNCVLDQTGGVCPVTRCAKGIMNGPCGGVDGGKCEVDPNQECAWVTIYDRMEQLGRGEDAEKIIEPRDFSRRITCRAWGLPEGGSK